MAAAAEKALKEYKTLHPDVRDEDIRVELPPPRNRHLPGRLPQVPPPLAYVQVHHANRTHVPIAHPVMPLPFPNVVPAFDFERMFRHGLPGLREFGLQAPPENEAQVMFPMPPGAGFNPLFPPLPMPPHLPHPFQALPPLHMALDHAPRMAGRGRQRR